MKAVISYVSVHHGDMKKIVDEIAREHKVEQMHFKDMSGFTHFISKI